MFKIKGIPRSIFVLGAVSFLTDVSADMIYPLLPLFLTQYLGVGQWFIGLIEGVAEFTAAIFTLLSGVWADKAKDRSKLVLAGYTFSSLARPLVAVAWTPWVVLFVRFLDRTGRGIRTAPRDALIADTVPKENRGRAFGLQRACDNAGAVAGPLIASLLLAGWVTNLRVLFAIAAIPGLLAVALVAWKVREVEDRAHSKIRVSFAPPSGRLRAFLIVYFIFILSCSSDAFLLLRCAELGIAAPLIPIVWMLFNAVKALTTMPLGALSDRIGRRKVIFAGWIIYTLIYAGLGFAATPLHGWLLFAAYGLYYGFTEGVERAFLADHSSPEERGRMFGWFYLSTGVGALIASVIFGAVWQGFGSKTAFLASAAVSFGACVLLLIFMRRYPSAKTSPIV